MTKQEQQAQALTNATVNQSVMNYASIFAGFMARGILESDIRPRENVFTYNAWLALGRQVRKGEHGVKVVTFVPMTKEDKETGERKGIGRRPWTTTVFHVSQTELVFEVSGYDADATPEALAKRQAREDATDEMEANLDATGENVEYAGE